METHKLKIQKEFASKLDLLAAILKPGFKNINKKRFFISDNELNRDFIYHLEMIYK